MLSRKVLQLNFRKQFNIEYKNLDVFSPIVYSDIDSYKGLKPLNITLNATSKNNESKNETKNKATNTMDKTSGMKRESLLYKEVSLFMRLIKGINPKQKP